MTHPTRASLLDMVDKLDAELDRLRASHDLLLAAAKAALDEPFPVYVDQLRAAIAAAEELQPSRS